MTALLAKVSNTKPSANPGSEFGAFLFASVGEEKNGMLLSVVSALSRRGLDPWQEAAALARLPTEAATQSLAALIGQIPDLPAAQAEPFTIARRLVALLPHKATTEVPSNPFRAAGLSSKSPAAFYVLIVIMALFAQLFIAGRQPETPAKDAPTTATSTSSAKVPLHVDK